MKLNEILRDKGTIVFTIRVDATMADVAAELVEHNCGALIVCDGEQIVGIISERDMLRTLAAHEQLLTEIAVRQCMTTDVITGSPDDLVETTMGLMTENRIRHLPLLEDGKLAGLVSIGDVVKAQYDKMTIENRFLKDYIQS
jgi:CBS domain-containing protein